MNILNDFKKIIMGEDKEENNNLLRNIVILGLIGVLFLLLGNSFFSSTDKPTKPPVTDKSPPPEQSSLIDYPAIIASDLEEIISLVNGVGKVKVKVFVQTGPQFQYEFNQSQTQKVTSETDQNGGERKIEEDTRDNDLVILENGQGSEEPVISQKLLPQIEGVLIVAQGAEISQIKYNISKAVSRFLNLPVHKISVLPYERR